MNLKSGIQHDQGIVRRRDDYWFQHNSLQCEEKMNISNRAAIICGQDT